MTSWEPQFLRTGDEERLLQLLTESFGTWPNVEVPVDPLAHLEWKLQGGDEGGYRAAVVMQESTIVGSIVLSIRPVKVKGRLMMATTGGDVAVLPQYRSSRVLSTIQRFTLASFSGSLDLTFGYLSRKPAVNTVARHGGLGLVANAIRVLVASPRELQRGSAREGSYNVANATSFDRRIDAFWEKASTPFDFIPARTRDYLNWRYCDRRGGVSVIKFAVEKDHILGYIVARTSHGKGYVADLLALPGRLDVIASLVSDVLAQFAREGTERVDCWLPSHHAYGNLLAESGFARQQTSKPFMYRPLKASEADLDFLRAPRAAVHLTIGDTDLV